MNNHALPLCQAQEELDPGAAVAMGVPMSGEKQTYICCHLFLFAETAAQASHGCLPLSDCLQ